SFSWHRASLVLEEALASRLGAHSVLTCKCSARNVRSIEVHTGSVPKAMKAQLTDTLEPRSNENHRQKRAQLPSGTKGRSKAKASLLQIPGALPNVIPDRVPGKVPGPSVEGL